MQRHGCRSANGRDTLPAALVGPMILPLMIFHQIQLIVRAVLARHYAENSDYPEETSQIASTFWES